VVVLDILMALLQTVVLEVVVVLEPLAVMVDFKLVVMVATELRHLIQVLQ
jgi:hypothetical protein